MMTLAQIQNQIKNQTAKIAEQQQELLDAQKELSLLLEKKKIME
jgi:cell division protein FtsL